MSIRFKSCKLAAILCCCAFFSFQCSVSAFETLGAFFEFDAAQDVGGDAVWTETGLFGTETFTFVGGATPTAVQVSDGTLNLFAHSVGADGVSNVYEGSFNPQLSRRDATFEVWFKPNDLTTADQIIHETGGSGRGTIISLSGSNLEFLAKGANPVTLATTLVDTDWHQVIGVLNNISNDGSTDDFIQLYVDGAPVGTSPTLQIDDWAGGNQGGLGSFGGATHPTNGQIAGNNTGVDFNGNIHLNRFYDRALSSAEILANYNAVVNPGPTWAVDANGGWNTGANWNGGVVPGVGDQSGGDAILGPVISAPTTVTLDVNANLGGLALNDTEGYTIAAGGGILTFTGSTELRATSGAHEIAAPIAGSSGILKTGGGTVAISGANTFSGTVAVSGGTLAVSSDGNLGNAANGVEFNSGVLRVDGTTFNTLSRSVTMTGSGTLNVADASNTVDVTGSVTGTGNLVKSGDGAAQLSNAAAYDGNLSVNGGALIVNSATGLGTTTGTTQVGADGGTVELDGSGGSLTIAENFSRLLARFDGVPEAHIRNSAGNNTITGTIEAGGGAFGNARFENTADGSTLTLDTTVSYVNEDTAYNFVFQGTGDFQVGSGTPGSGKIVGNNVSVVVELEDPTDTVTISTAASTTDTSNATGSYWGGNTTIRSGTLAIESDGANNGEIPSATINVQNGTTFDVSDFTTYSLQVVDDPDATPGNGDEIGQVLSGGGTINTGSGTLRAFEDSVITPGDSAGTLTVSGNLTIDQFVANPNGALNYELSNVTTTGGEVNDLLAVSGNLNLNADGAAGGSQFKLNITPIDGSLAAGTYTIMTRGGTSSTTATSADFDIALVNAQGTTLNSRQDDSSSVSINANTVTVNFSAAQSHDWAGTTDGTWDVGTSANWSSTDGLFFDLDTASFGDGTGQTAVNIVGPVTPGGMNFTNSADTYTFTGSGIEGSAAMNLAAGAKAVLANSANSFSGGVNIGSGATLTLGDGTSNDGALAGGSSVANSGTLAFNRTGYGFFNQTISGTGVVEVNGGYVDLADTNTYSGGSVINGGTLRIRNPSAAGPGSIIVNNGAAFETGYFSNQAFSKAVTLNDGASLSVTDPDDSGALPANTGQITWTNPITLGGTGGTVDTTAGDGIVPGMTVAGGITGSGDLTLSAAADRLLVVNSALTHSGNTAIGGGGTVALQGSTAISSPLVELRSSSTLDVTATTSGTLALSGQALTGRGTVAGNLTTGGNSTIRVGGVASGAPLVATGLQLYYDASQDTSGDDTWEDLESAAGNVDLNFPGAASTVPVNDLTFTALTAAYDISASGSALSPGAQNTYFDFRSQSSGTFEIVFNVTSTNAGDEQVLMDIGGGNGVAVTLDGGTLTAGVNGDATDTTAFSTSLATGWHHAVVVIEDTDPANGSNDVFTLYVDNSEVGSLATVDIDKYSGGNGWGFGGPNSVTLDPTETAAGAAILAAPIDFHGQIAIARYYQAALTAGDVNTNFQAIQADGPFVGVDTLTVDGDLTLDATSTIELDIFDSMVGNDLLDITGLFTADGTLDVSLAGTVSLGETFDILDFGSASGSFDSINLPLLAGGLDWDASQLLVTGILEVIVAVDLDNDGDVDGADFLLIQQTDPSLIPAWQSQYGTGSLAAASTAVPEPSSILLMSVGALTWFYRKSR